jgi:cytochrome c oxidase subunit 1
MPRRYYDYLPMFQTGHRISTYGSWIISAGLFMAFGNLFYTMKKGPKAERNPFRSLSLEWQTDSPPIHENFAEIPTVTDWTYGYSNPGKK